MLAKLPSKTAFVLFTALLLLSCQHSTPQTNRQTPAAGDAKSASANYREAQDILAAYSDSVDSFDMHWLGAQALARNGDRASDSRPFLK